MDDEINEILECEDLTSYASQEAVCNLLAEEDCTPVFPVNDIENSLFLTDIFE